MDFAFCILHSAFRWSPRLVSRQRLLLFREELICLSYSGMDMVVPAGNAPASSGYQPGALLLSYETYQNGCQTWTRTKTSGLIPPLRDYFDISWQWHCRQDFHLHRSV